MRAGRERRVVSNSTVLVWLAKAGRLNLLISILHEVVTPPEVERETVERGEEKGEPDALVIERAIEDKWIKVISPSEEAEEIIHRLMKFGIDRGEAEAIALANQLKIEDVLMDQTHAREAAVAVGQKPRGTIYVLLKSLDLGLISWEEYLDCLERLAKLGFYLRTETYIEAIKLGKRILEKRS